jgi:hypothetical protein
MGPADRAQDNYDMADSLANWGPAVPTDFVHNFEADAYRLVREAAIFPDDGVPWGAAARG